jgi:hypothetical protein
VPPRALAKYDLLDQFLAQLVVKALAPVTAAKV